MITTFPRPECKLSLGENRNRLNNYCKPFLVWDVLVMAMNVLHLGWAVLDLPTGRFGHDKNLWTVLVRAVFSYRPKRNTKQLVNVLESTFSGSKFHTFKMRSHSNVALTGNDLKQTHICIKKLL